MIFLALRKERFFSVALVGDEIIPQEPMLDDGTYHVIYRDGQQALQCVGRFVVKDCVCGPLQEAPPSLRENLRSIIERTRAEITQTSSMIGQGEAGQRWMLAIEALIAELEQEAVPTLAELMHASPHERVVYGYADPDSPEDELQAIEELAAAWWATFS